MQPVAIYHIDLQKIEPSVVGFDP